MSLYDIVCGLLFMPCAVEINSLNYIESLGVPGLISASLHHPRVVDGRMEGNTASGWGL